jgi:hypothetical protein
MRAARIDANQSAIIKALRDAGASVQPLHTVGSGCPDILCGWRGTNLLIEVKDGEKPPSARQLTPDQAVWHRDWRGKVYVVKDVDEALMVLSGVWGVVNP